MRVRIRRFKRLRSRTQPGQPQLVEQAVRERDVQSHRGVLPPSASVAGHAGRQVRRQPPRDKLTVGCPTPYPLLQLDPAETMPEPFVLSAEDARRLREPEVG